MIWYVNGKFVEDEKAVITVTDLGLQRGWAVFEYLRTYGGVPFQLKKHLERYFKACPRLYLKPPLDKDKMTALIQKLIKINFRRHELGIKIILTAGSSRDGVTTEGRASLLVLTMPIKAYPRRLYFQGVRLLISNRGRYLPEIKTTNCLAAMQALVEAKKQGFDDALFVGQRGEILEATRSNFFAFFGDELWTAKEKVLVGVTRGLVIELAQRRFKVKEKTFYLKDLEKADEAFVTSTDKEIMPVVGVESIRIGNGRVGFRTKDLVNRFRSLTK